ncbi:MAG: DUF6252 family protein [Bacteroidota bacterium]
MKRIKLSLITLLLVIPIIFSSCKKDDDPIAENAKVTASIDGVEWNGITTQASNSTMNVLNISGVSESGAAISITIVNGLEEGTYILNKTSFSVGTYTEGSEGYTTNGSSDVGGEVIITEVNYTDKTISGTFSFDVYGLSTHNIKSITNGVINKVTFTN